MKPQVAVILIFAALLALQPFARAQSVPMLIDDFSTGPDSRSLTTGIDSSAHQIGAMLGGDRWINLYASDGPFEALSSFRARPSTGTEPSALILNAGYRGNARVDLVYGYNSQLQLHLRPLDNLTLSDQRPYDRFVLHFDGISNGLDGFALSGIGSLVWNPSGYLFLGCAGGRTRNTPVTIELPFNLFQGAGGFDDVTQILFYLQPDAGPAGFALTSIEKAKEHTSGALVCNSEHSLSE